MKRALLVGINYFGSDAQLEGCILDVASMKEYLSGRGYTEFTVLVDAKDDPKHARPDSPTREHIIAAMKTFIGSAKRGDSLYVHYSGHGAQLDDRNSDENDKQDECICPVDYDFSLPDSGFIRDDMLNDLLVKALPAGVKLRVTFDSCHSGSAIDLPCHWDTTSELITENKSAVERDVVFISGCRDNQFSADSEFNGRPSGALTWALLKSLNEILKSGKFVNTYRWKDLVQMMRLKLRRGGYDQVPQLDMARREQLSSIVDLV